MIIKSESNVSEVDIYRAIDETEHEVSYVL